MEILYNWEVLTHNLKVPNFFYIQADDGAGHIIRTTRVVQIEGKQITTITGAKYILDNAAPQYVEWCKAHNYYVPTLEEPILVTKNSGET